MPIAMECQGATSLLDLLERTVRDGAVAEDAVHRCLLQNSFLINFYCQWEGVTAEALARALGGPSSAPDPHPVLARLQLGFQEASARAEDLRRRIATLRDVDLEAVETRLRRYLPANTPIDCTIHLTIDEFNGAFQYQNGIGLSLTRSYSDPDLFSDLICHELHHIGFQYWAARDARRQALLRDQTPIAVALEHIENLIREGMAVYFFTSAQFGGSSWGLVPKSHAAAYRARVDSFRAGDSSLFRRAEQILREAFRPSPDLEACRHAALALAVDLQGIQPSGHYVGWRMIQTIATRDTIGQILANIVDVSGFLQQYNEAADRAGAYVFSPEVVRDYAALWR